MSIFHSEAVDTDKVALNDGCSTRRRYVDLTASETVDAASLRVLLTEMHGEFCAHSWKRVPVDITPQDLFDWENNKRPTTIQYYYENAAEEERPVLVAAASVADAISYDVPINRFPVLARCYVRPSFRGAGLYGRILQSRLSSLIQRAGTGLRAIHMGTADERVVRTITDRNLPWNGFVRLGWEHLSIGAETVRVGGYLMFKPDYAEALLAGSSKLTFSAGGTSARDVFEHLFAGCWSGPGDAYSRIAELLSVNPIASKEKSVLPIHELIDFCAKIPLVRLPI